MDQLDRLYAGLRRAQAAGDEEAAGVIRERIRGAMAQQQGAEATKGMGAGSRFLAGVGQGMVNVGQQVGNMVGLVPDQKLAEEAQLNKPLLDTTAGKVGSFVGETAATLPIGAGAGGLAAKAGITAARAPILNMALQAATEGAVLAGPNQRGSGAALGAATAGVLGKGAQALRAGYQGLVKPSQAARFLDAQGVESMTLGQMAPGGKLAQIEQAAESLPGVGPFIHGRREQALKEAGDAFLAAGNAPGQAARRGLSQADQIAAQRAAFGPAYDSAFAGQKVYPAIHNGKGGVTLRDAFAAAAGDPSVLAQAPEREAVAGFLSNVLSVVPKSKGPLKQVDAAVVQKMRHDVREAIRDEVTRAGGFTPTARLLKNGEEALTQVLESQMPADALAALRATDRAFAQHMTGVDAVSRMKDKARLGTSEMSNAAAASAKARLGKAGYAAGGGGLQRAVAKASNEVFGTQSAPTGQRLLTLGLNTPLVGPAVAGGIGVLSASPVAKKTLLGMKPWQRKAQGWEKALRRRAGDEAIGTVGATAAANVADEADE